MSAGPKGEWFSAMKVGSDPPSEVSALKACWRSVRAFSALKVDPGLSSTAGLGAMKKATRFPRWPRMR